MAITKHKVFPLPQMAAGKANNINERTQMPRKTW